METKTKIHEALGLCPVCKYETSWTLEKHALNHEKSNNWADGDWVVYCVIQRELLKVEKWYHQQELKNRNSIIPKT